MTDSTEASQSAFRESTDERAARDAPQGGARVLPLLAVFGALLLAYWLWNPHGEDRTRGPHHAAVGAKLVWSDLEPLVHVDAPLTAQDVAGRVTLLNFWGPWCPPCREEFPKLMTLRDDFARTPEFRLVSVACGASLDEPLAVLKKDTVAYLDWLKLQPPIYSDESVELRQRVAITAKLDGFAYPTSVLLDGEGTIRGVWIGYYEGEEEKIKGTVHELLAAARAKSRS